ncbi:MULTISPECIES: alpha/beta family hydrolase [Kitasatospora]|uniref:alpha/beta hydrolase family protein n=1 Tax=Kitasatospora TaxID=2063 RepID=UPI000C7128A9|nr:alpha/beta family hydrolase [Kitasatospora sp. GP30]MDH6139542.1 putative alpha/beta-hydrolase family hydrolase [Kitasatospora sp. GP30]
MTRGTTEGAEVERTLVATPVGDARISWHRPAGPARALLGLVHGTGRGIEAPDMVALAAALPAQGITVALVEQPWKVAGEPDSPAAPTLDAGWLPVAERLAAEGLPLLVGGRSAGARVACRTGARSGAVAVLALSFPLVPPDRPQESRAGELLGSGLPTLVVQGTDDEFGGPDVFPELPAGWRLTGVPAADHIFAPPGESLHPTPEALALITATVADWLASLTL